MGGTLAPTFLKNTGNKRDQIQKNTMDGVDIWGGYIVKNKDVCGVFPSIMVDMKQDDLVINETQTNTTVC